MKLHNQTPDGMFTLSIESVLEDDDMIPGESMYQLVQLLEHTAQAIRLAVDPDLQRCEQPEAVGAVDPVEGIVES